MNMSFLMSNLILATAAGASPRAMPSNFLVYAIFAHSEKCMCGMDNWSSNELFLLVIVFSRNKDSYKLLIISLNI